MMSQKQQQKNYFKNLSVHDFKNKTTQKITVFLPLWENVSKWVYSDRLFHVYGDRIWGVQLKTKKSEFAGFIKNTFLLFLLLLNCVLVFFIVFEIWLRAWPDCTADLCVRDGLTQRPKMNHKGFFFFVRDKENREKKKKKKEKEEEEWLCEWCNIHEPERWGVGCYPYLAIRGWVMILYFFFLVEAKRMFYKWSLLLYSPSFLFF